MTAPGTAPSGAPIPLQGPLLGLDAGEKRVGVSAASALGIALPLGFLEARPRAALLEKIRDLARDRQCVGLVIGLPLNMDGSEGPAARRARDLGAEAGAATGLPVEMWDERLSTFEAERKLAESPFKMRRRKGRVDAVAAAGILQSFLSERVERAKKQEEQ
jgi:putative Holliday junction resolvase